MPQSERHVRLFRNGRNQALRIPREFELEGGGSNHAQGRWVLVEKNTVAFSVDFEGADVVSIGI